MKSVIFCGSTKYSNEMNEWGHFLRAAGVDVYVPEDFSGSPIWKEGTESEIRDFAHKLTLDHFNRIKDYDVVFIFNGDGYSGNSTTLEIGCAYGRNKPVFAKERDSSEVCRDVLFNKYCGTKEELLESLKFS